MKEGWSKLSNFQFERDTAEFGWYKMAVLYTIILGARGWIR